VLDAWGFEKFLAAVETKLGKPLSRVASNQVAEPNRQHRQAHIGVHAQKQAGRVWVGVVLPVGRLTAAQMRGVASIARELGDGDIRLTVWQNLLISGVAAERAGEVEARLQAIGLTSKASSIRAGLVACTGNTGCKLASSNTKDTAMAIAEWVEARVGLDTPINVHLTGCPNSCAQHYIGDIGLIGCRVPIADSDETLEGFHVHVGGGFGADAAIGREIYRDVKVEDCPPLIERMLRAYLAARVRADLAGESRYAVSKSAASEETAWGLPPHSAALDRERWTRAMTVFREHPFRTVRAFGASALEHTLHPSPDVLRAARLNFRGDIVVLGTAWGALLILAAVALWDLAKLLRRRPATLNERFLVVMVAICSILTLASGLSFGAGSRLRAPLEIVVPLLASAALFRWSSLPPLQPVLETVRARAHRPLGAWVEDLMSRTATVRRTAIS